ncbi:MAG: hypothetical protein V5804_14990 [Mucilaginibacter sp.]|uniref:hypothetical protein n=1 Tax=Mucilaginibacter sp. TaxID=1882438 RepID=UPI0034E3D48E
MSKFVLEPCNDIVGKITFLKIIENTICYWNIFCLRIESEGTWEEQIDLLKSRMDEVSNSALLPHNKFKKLDPPKTDEFEVKTGNLRAYLILHKSAYIIMYAGKKTDQAKDLRTFRAIKKRYLEATEDDITRKTT